MKNLVLAFAVLAFLMVLPASQSAKAWWQNYGYGYPGSYYGSSFGGFGGLGFGSGIPGYGIYNGGFVGGYPYAGQFNVNYPNWGGGWGYQVPRTPVTTYTDRYYGAFGGYGGQIPVTSWY